MCLALLLFFFALHCCWLLSIASHYSLCIIIGRYSPWLLLFVVHLHCYYLVFAHVVIIYCASCVVACFSPLLLFALCCSYLPLLLLLALCYYCSPFVFVCFVLFLLTLCCYCLPCVVVAHLVLLFFTLVATASFGSCIMPKHGKYDYTHD